MPVRLGAQHLNQEDESRANIFCRSRTACSVRLVFRDRRRTTKAIARPDTGDAPGGVQHRHNLATERQDPARPRYPRRHFIPDSPDGRRQGSEQGNARPGGRRDPKTRRLFCGEGASHQSGGNDRILVQIPGLDTAKIQEAREQLSRVAKLEFRLVYPDNGERLRAIDEGKEVIPPEYRIEVYKMAAEGNEKPREERLLVKKKADLGGDRVRESHAYYGNEGWTVQLKFDGEGAKQFGKITEQYKGHRFAIVLDGVIQSAPVIRDAIYGGDAIITGKFDEKEARGLASVLENPLQTPVSIEEERSVSPTLGMDSIRASIMAGLMGLAITLVCVLIYYRLPGLVANLALLVNLVLLIGALTMFRFVLTLPGIAGIF